MSCLLLPVGGQLLTVFAQLQIQCENIRSRIPLPLLLYSPTLLSGPRWPARWHSSTRAGGTSDAISTRYNVHYRHSFARVPFLAHRFLSLVVVSVVPVSVSIPHRCYRPHALPRPSTRMHTLYRIHCLRFTPHPCPWSCRPPLCSVHLFPFPCISLCSHLSVVASRSCPVALHCIALYHTPPLALAFIALAIAFAFDAPASTYLPIYLYGFSSLEGGGWKGKRAVWDWSWSCVSLLVLLDDGCC